MRGLSVKTLKRTLKKAGLKTTGRKAALTRRAKKAHLLRGGAGACTTDKGAPGNCMPLGPEPVGRLPGNRYGGRGTRRGGVLPKRSNADGVKPGDETKGSDETSSSSSSSESGLSNKTPEPSGAEVPSSLPSRSGGRHRRGHRSRKNKGGMYGHSSVKYCPPPGYLDHAGRCVG